MIKRKTRSKVYILEQFGKNAASSYFARIQGLEMECQAHGIDTMDGFCFEDSRLLLKLRHCYTYKV